MRFLIIAFSVVIAGVAPTTGAQAQVAGFADVPPTHWAASSIAHLTQAGIIQGRTNQPLGKNASPSAAKFGAKAAYDGNRPVTRYELAVTLYRFVQYIEHADKQGKTKFSAQAMPSTGAEALKRLISEGYLPADSPLAKEANKTVSANQFADALAQVLERSREKTTPISPDLAVPESGRRKANPGATQSGHMPPLGT
jgi:hypothetical protein